MRTREHIPMKPTAAAPSLFTPAPFATLQRKCACGGSAGSGSGSGPSGGECAECKKKKMTLQRRAIAGAEPATVPPIVHEVLSSPGQPLDEGTRAFFEPRFGHDFSKVRVHVDTTASESARAVNALAYTVGQDLVFAGGKYAPGTAETKRLLAHELTHTVQQRHHAAALPGALGVGPNDDAAEREATRAERALSSSSPAVALASPFPSAPSGFIRRKVNPDNVSCRATGLTNPNLTGDQAVAALQAADADAVELALRAHLLLDAHLLLARGGQPVDTAFDTILHEELGLTLTNPAHFPLIAEQSERFQKVHDLLASGFLHYICRGGTVSLVGCSPGTCGQDFAFSCPANRLVVLCQSFWDIPDERPGTILHEPFHILFTMARHQNNALRRADASCFESFAIRVAGRTASASCVGHTDG